MNSLRLHAARRLIGPRLGLVAAATLLLALTTPRAASAQARLHPAAPAKSEGQLVLTNATPDSVRVEVRVGEASACDKNAPVRTRIVAPGKSWSISATEAVCWRSSTGAGQTSWGPWQRRAIVGGTVQKGSP